MNKMQANSRLLCDAYGSVLLRRASFSAPKPGRWAALFVETEEA